MPSTKPRTKKAKQAAMQAEMHKFRAHELHSGSATGPIVTDRKQAIAIALSVSGQSKRRKGKQKGSVPGISKRTR